MKQFVIIKDSKDNIRMLYRIEKINELHGSGNTIVYYTARGTKTGLNWYELTISQLNKWDVNIMN